MENKKELTQSEKISLPLKEIAKRIRNQLKEELPNCKFSITTEYYSMGCSLHAYLIKADRRIIRKVEEISDKAILRLGTSYSREDLNERQNADNHQLSACGLRGEFEEDSWCNGSFLTLEGFKMLKRMVEIIDQYNYDNSDSQTDYYDVNFALNLGLGKWNKAFEDFKEEKEEGIAQTCLKCGYQIEAEKYAPFCKKCFEYEEEMQKNTGVIDNNGEEIKVGDVLDFKMGNNDYIGVTDSITGKTFIFKNHKDKEKFFDLWDKLVLEVRD